MPTRTEKNKSIGEDLHSIWHFPPLHIGHGSGDGDGGGACDSGWGHTQQCLQQALNLGQLLSREEHCPSYFLWPLCPDNSYYTSYSVPDSKHAQKSGTREKCKDTWSGVDFSKTCATYFISPLFQMRNLAAGLFSFCGSIILFSITFFACVWELGTVKR